MLISRKDVSDYLEKMGKNSKGEILKLIHEKLPIESLGILKIDFENGDRFNWIILIRGPNNTPYENGLFRIRIRFDRDTRFEYDPFNPFIETHPDIRFLNQIYHLQVNPSSGNICVLMLFKWERDTSIVELLVMLYLFFIFDQNPDSPFGPERGHEYRYNRSEFDRKAREFTKKYCEIYFSNNKEKDEEDKFLSIIFTSTDQVIHYSIVCKFEDYFSQIEQKLYKEYPEYKNSNNTFLCKGSLIQKDKSLKDNKIKNSDVITLIIDN